MRFVLVSVVAATGTAYGEFLRTAPGVYQSTGKRAKVILSQEQPGIFVLYGDEVELQLFNPAVLKSSPNVDPASHEKIAS